MGLFINGEKVASAYSGGDKIYKTAGGYTGGLQWKIKLPRLAATGYSYSYMSACEGKAYLWSGDAFKGPTITIVSTDKNIKTFKAAGNVVGSSGLYKKPGGNIFVEIDEAVLEYKEDGTLVKTYSGATDAVLVATGNGAYVLGGGMNSIMNVKGNAIYASRLVVDSTGKKATAFATKVVGGKVVGDVATGDATGMLTGQMDLLKGKLILPVYMDDNVIYCIGMTPSDDAHPYMYPIGALDWTGKEIFKISAMGFSGAPRFGVNPMRHLFVSDDEGRVSKYDDKGKLLKTISTGIPGAAFTFTTDSGDNVFIDANANEFPAGAANVIYDRALKKVAIVPTTSFKCDEQENIFSLDYEGNYSTADGDNYLSLYY
ncbi:MAG: hypothetical protein LKF36_05455 [Lactobacillus sp.]|jgi:hypothetical protein|nr:hypothetical protein [Lactobacillus sp.]